MLKLFFESDKIVLSKYNIFVENKGYNSGLFLLNVSRLVNKISFSITYLIDSINLWHDRLVNVDFFYIKN